MQTALEPTAIPLVRTSGMLHHIAQPMNTTDPQQAAAEDVIAGLLSIAAHLMRHMPRDELLTALAGVEVGSHALHFGVSLTGAEVVIIPSLTDLCSGVSIDLPTLNVYHAVATKQAGLH